MTAIFVTATGTDIGKTFVTAGVIRHLRREGRSVAAVKPVVTGFDPGAPDGSDPAVLLAALGRTATLDEIARISPWRFKAPLAPGMAAAREGSTLDFDAVIEFSRQEIATPSDILLIEGIGGVMVPLDARRTVLDWMAALNLPLILVAGSYLGTISHTLTALDTLARRNLRIAALVVSETGGSEVPLADTIATIAGFAAPVAVVGLPRLRPGADHSAFGEIAALL